MGSVLPDGWREICTKGHKSDHTSKCTNWICPQGRRYKEWSDVQIYFQLLNFEEDIPGVECRAENAKKALEPVEEEEVTLEEATKKEMEEKAAKIKSAKISKESNRKRKISAGSESSEGDDHVVKRRGRSKKKDDDYQPDVEIKASGPTDVKNSPKKTRRSVAAAAAVKNDSAGSNEKVTVVKSKDVKTTLDESTEVPKKNTGKASDMKSLKTNSDVDKSAKKSTEVNVDSGKANVNPKDEKQGSSNVINLDSPGIGAKKVPGEKISRSVSIVKVDDEIQVVKDSPSTQVRVSGEKEECIVKSSTQKLYDTRFEMFKDYCSKSGAGDPMKASSAVIDKFLQQIQKEKSLGKSVISGYKAAIVKIQASSKPDVAGTTAESNIKVLKTSGATIKPIESNSAQVTQNIVSKPSVQSQGNVQVSTVVQQPQARPSHAQQQTRQTVPNVQTSVPGARQQTPQAGVRQQTPQSISKQAPQTVVRQQTPQSLPRQQTPQSNLKQQNAANRQQTSQTTRQQAPQSVNRQTTPQSAVRQSSPQVNSQPTTLKSTNPRAQAVVTQAVRLSTPRQQGPQVRGIQPNPQVRQGTPQPRQLTPQTRQQQPSQVRQQLVKGTTPQTSKIPQFSELPQFLKSLVNFPCKLENNLGGGPSLYRAAAQHVGIGQEGWQDLRKYCHLKLLEWFQWYEPYYSFPLQVKIRVRNQTIQKTFPSSAEFQKFLKTEESLYSYYMSECELYCLANVLGVPIYQLTYNLVGVGGKPEERCRWDTLDPHHGLIHQNKFNVNKDPLYLLYEDKVHFSKIVQIKK